jgi:hypothetical protein
LNTHAVNQTETTMRRTLTILAACGLALGAAACGKPADTGSNNLSEADNMLVPADENVADAGVANEAVGNDVAVADNASVGNDTSGNAQ